MKLSNVRRNDIEQIEMTIRNQEKSENIQEVTASIFYVICKTIFATVKINLANPIIDAIVNRLNMEWHVK